MHCVAVRLHGAEKAPLQDLEFMHYTCMQLHVELIRCSKPPAPSACGPEIADHAAAKLSGVPSLVPCPLYSRRSTHSNAAELGVGVGRGIRSIIRPSVWGHVNPAVTRLLRRLRGYSWSAFHFALRWLSDNLRKMTRYAGISALRCFRFAL